MGKTTLYPPADLHIAPRECSRRTDRPQAEVVREASQASSREREDRPMPRSSGCAGARPACDGTRRVVDALLIEANRHDGRRWRRVRHDRLPAPHAQYRGAHIAFFRRHDADVRRSFDYPRRHMEASDVRADHPRVLPSEMRPCGRSIGQGHDRSRRER
jgi:hypothetical protein